MNAITSPSGKIVTLFTILLIIWSAVLTYFGYRDTTINFIYNPVMAVLIYFFGAGVAIRAIGQAQLKSTIGRMLFAVASALILFGIADLIWGYYVLILKVEVPYPSLADVFFTLYYPALVTAFAYLLVILKTTITPRRVIETAAMFIVSFIVIFFVLVRPSIPAGPLTLTTFFDIIYPLGDVLIITMAFLGFRVSGGKIRSVLPIFICAMIVETVADIVFSTTTKNGSYFNGSYVDVIFLLNAWLLTIGVLSIEQQFTNPSSNKTFQLLQKNILL